LNIGDNKIIDRYVIPQIDFTAAVVAAFLLSSGKGWVGKIQIKIM